MRAGSFVIILIDYETVYINDPTNREVVTIIVCINRGGHYIPNIVIFKGAYYLSKYFNNDIDGNTLWVHSESGFTNNKLTIKWLQYFNLYIEKRTLGRYRILIFNRYRSYIT